MISSSTVRAVQSVQLRVCSATAKKPQFSWTFDPRNRVFKARLAATERHALAGLIVLVYIREASFSSSHVAVSVLAHDVDVYISLKATYAIQPQSFFNDWQ
jgi:hypothetical protein